MSKTLSELIKECQEGAAGNPYQGTDKKILFVCSMGILRSATAARMYGSRYNTRAAGTESDALVPITTILIAWADEIVFVNQENYKYVKEDYPDLDKEKKVVVLNIPDRYPHMHPELVAAFKEQYDSQV